LYEETWMKRSTSYLATASAMRSTPSTWTSSRSKFLDVDQYLVSCHAEHIDWLGGVTTANEVVYSIWVSYAFFNRLGIPEIKFLAMWVRTA
jgi:hypothetical protein